MSRNPSTGVTGCSRRGAAVLMSLSLLLAVWAGSMVAPGTAVASEPVSAPTATAAPTLPVVAGGQEAVTAVASEGAIDLSGEWRYQVVSAVEDSLFDPATDDSAWPTTVAPGRWADQGIGGEDVIAVVYRRTVEVPAEWQGNPIGISAWFYPGGSVVHVNGEVVEPQGSLFALFADVGDLLHYGQSNVIAVSTTGDGIRELAEVGPPLLGPVGQRILTKVVRQDVTIPAPDMPLSANLFSPEGGEGLPAVVFAATGHADYSLKDDWQVLNEDMARQGIVSLAVAFNKFTAPEFDAVFQYLSALDSVDPERMALVGAMKATQPTVQAAIASENVRAVILVSSAKIPEIAQLGDRPVLFICSEKETGAPTCSFARKMADQITGPHQILTLPGKSTGVNVLDTDWNQVRAAMLDWLERYLVSR